MFRTSKAKQLPIQEEHHRLAVDQGERERNHPIRTPID
jgi:hypothetical protein